MVSKAEWAKAKYWSSRRFTDAVKVTAGCIDCGFAVHPAAMDFDHQGDKRCEVQRMHQYSLAAQAIEIMKCDVRCANCHRIRHAGEVVW